MSITATELKANLSKYLLLSATEDVYITRNGKVISKLTNPFQERVAVAKSLFGILPDDITEEEAREERLNRIGEHGWIPALPSTPCKTENPFAKTRRNFF